MKSFRRRGPEAHLGFELNIVPIIDCFTILITFMLASGVYISIAVLDVGVSAGGKEVIEKKDDPGLNLSISMMDNSSLVIKLSGKAQESIAVSGARGWDFRSLGNRLASIKAKYPELKLATLVAGPEIAYQDVIRAMDTTKKTHPDILLGGF